MNAKATKPILKINKKMLAGLISLFCLFFIYCLILNPQKYIASTLNGFTVWATVLLPALFPFFFFTKMLQELNIATSFCNNFSFITKKLFRLDGIASYIFFMGMLSGYPVGAKLTSELYTRGAITSVEAKKITTFSSTSGPLFIIGTVGIGMLHSQIAGIIIFASHIIASILNGVLYRNIGNSKTKTLMLEQKTNPTSIEDLLGLVMYNCIIAILMIGGYVALFFMIITVLNDYNLLNPFVLVLQNILNVFNINPSLASPIINGLVEITKGCLDLSALNVGFNESVLATTFIISFGGLCIAFQALSFLSKCKISLKFFLFQKFTHAVFSVLVCYLILLFI